MFELTLGKEAEALEEDACLANSGLPDGPGVWHSGERAGAYHGGSSTGDGVSMGVLRTVIPSPAENRGTGTARIGLSSGVSCEKGGGADKTVSPRAP